MIVTKWHGVCLLIGLIVGFVIGSKDVDRLEIEVAGARFVAQNYAEILRTPSAP